MFCYIPFLSFIVSTLQKCTKSPSIPLLVSAGAHPGLRWRRFGLVPQLAAQTCSLQLLTPQLTASPGCSALPEGCSDNSEHICSAKPSQHPNLALVQSICSPSSPPKEAVSVSLAEQGLASSVLWSCSTELWLALSACEIPLKPRGFLLSGGKHAEGLSGLGSYVLLMSGRRKMEIFSMSLFAL